MLNVMKMDLYRMFKSKITWIILIVVGILAVMTMFTYHSEHEHFVKRNLESMVAEGYTQEEAAEVLTNHAQDPMYSVDSIFDIFYFYSKLIVNSYIGLFIAIFTVIFVGSEKSTGFVKNIAGQPSIRFRTILSKCFSIIVFTSMILILYFAISVICSQLLFGYISFGLYSLSNMLAYTLTQMFLTTALCIVVMCISELIRNQAVSMAIGVLLPIGVLRMFTGKLDGLIENFSFTSQLITVNIASLPLHSNLSEYQHAWFVGTVFLVIAVAISIFSMTKRDIR